MAGAVAAAAASPLATWVVAACMSTACDDRRRRPSAIRPWGSGRSRRAGRSPAPCEISSGGGEPCAEFYSWRTGAGFSGVGGVRGHPTLSAMGKARVAGSPPRPAAASEKTTPFSLEPTKPDGEKKHAKQRRVVVTGMGVVTPLGHDPDVFYNRLLEGISAISEIETFDCSSYPTRIAGEIKSFSTDGCVSPKFKNRMDKFMLYTLTAGKKALENGGITEEIMSGFDKTRCGVLIGSALGGLKIMNDGLEALRISYRKVHPFCVPFSTTNMGSAMLAMDLGWMGPNYSISTACATSNFCILNAANHIRRGEADMMLCGGSDSVIIPIGLGGFVACRALSQRNDDPTKASRPWDVDRDGFVIGEGAGVLLLEELEHAKQRGANIYAEFLGGSFSCDAYHMTQPHPEGKGIVLCIEKALQKSGVSREDVNYVNAHATSTIVGDMKEYQALIHCFGKNPELRVNSTKSMIGHLLGASGAVEAVAVVQAIRTGWIHPNINLDNPENSVDLNLLVGTKKQRLDIKVALSNSFGFGGQNSSVLFAAYKEAPQIRWRGVQGPNEALECKLLTYNIHDGLSRQETSSAGSLLQAAGQVLKLINLPNPDGTKYSYLNT